jgi:hypothetical protein
MTEQEKAIIAQARQIVREETGTEDAELVLLVLARMFIVANHGASSGYLRLGLAPKPSQPKQQVEPL